MYVDLNHFWGGYMLLLMDDTILLSTTRKGIEYKLRILYEYCNEYGMKVNNDKTKFFVVNGEAGDKQALCVDGHVIDHCTSYVYLGSCFTCDGSVSTSVKQHATQKISHVLKFVSFVEKNNTVPFIVKRRVFDAALTSSLLYSCESWLSADIKPLIKLYHWALKALLGVRKNTSNLCCYAEIGYLHLKDLLQYRQHKFFHNLLQEKIQLTRWPIFLCNKINFSAEHTCHEDC